MHREREHFNTFEPKQTVVWSMSRHADLEEHWSPIAAGDHTVQCKVACSAFAAQPITLLSNQCPYHAHCEINHSTKVMQQIEIAGLFWKQKEKKVTILNVPKKSKNLKLEEQKVEERRRYSKARKRVWRPSQKGQRWKDPPCGGGQTVVWTYRTCQSGTADCRGTEVVFGGGGGACGRSPAGWGRYRTPQGQRHWRGQSRASLCEEGPGGRCAGWVLVFVTHHAIIHNKLLLWGDFGMSVCTFQRMYTCVKTLSLQFHFNQFQEFLSG